MCCSRRADCITRNLTDFVKEKANLFVYCVGEFIVDEMSALDFEFHCEKKKMQLKDVISSMEEGFDDCHWPAMILHLRPLLSQCSPHLPLASHEATFASSSLE